MSTIADACTNCGHPRHAHKRSAGACTVGHKLSAMAQRGDVPAPPLCDCKRYRTTTPGEPTRTGATRAARRQELAEGIAAAPKGDPKP